MQAACFRMLASILPLFQVHYFRRHRSDDEHQVKGKFRVPDAPLSVLCSTPAEHDQDGVGNLPQPRDHQEDSDILNQLTFDAGDTTMELDDDDVGCDDEGEDEERTSEAHKDQLRYCFLFIQKLLLAYYFAHSFLTGYSSTFGGRGGGG